MRLFSITFILFGLIAFAIANEQMNNCTDDGCADFYDGHTDSTPAPIVKIEPIKYIPVVDTTNGKDEFVMSLSQCIDHIYQDVPIEKQIPKTLIIAQAALETGWGVKVYETKCDSVRDYVRIINEVWAYEELRKVRDNGGDVYEMADHLTLYASKPTYTKLVKQLIKYNIEGVYDL